MLLTAQSVTPGTHAKEGINAFFYVHGADAVPGMTWEHPFVPVVVDLYPGTLTAQFVEVAPGGNVVRAFLDIVCKDGTAAPAIDTALDVLGRDLSAPRLGRSLVHERVAVRFGIEDGLRVQAGRYFLDLRAIAIRLLTQAPAQAPLVATPLVVEIETTHEGRIFRLEAQSRGLLPASSVPPPRSIKLDDATAVDLQRQWGPAELHLASILAGLSLEQLYARGGVRFVEKPSGRDVWSWPPPAPPEEGSGYCLGCHQHRTLVMEDGVFRCLNCGHAQNNDGRFVGVLQ